MATPGWYPDPAGRPGAFRYWDGQDWGAEATEHPYAAPPTAPPHRGTPTYQSYATEPAASYPPLGSQGYAPQGYPPQGWSPDPPRSSGRAVWLVLLAVLLTLVLGVATFLVVRPLVDDDDGSAARDTSTTGPVSQDPADRPSDQPSEQPSEQPTDQPSDQPTSDLFTDDRTPSARQCAGGSPRQGAVRITGGKQKGGGLTMPAPAGFSDADPLDQARAFTFATGVSAPSKIVADGWVAVTALGALPRVNGFGSTGQAAAEVLECMTQSSEFYENFSSARVTGARAIEVDGHPAWVVDAEIRVDDPEIDVEGDVARVVVVDTGDLERYGVLVSLVAIGQDELLAQQRALVDDLTVD
ncbi:DUF2510 domain-containing protein [Nocardioides plantarum]|uniref:DUF2510 domain-containing protein n=1 Tax=Nocardioides plantarum TaxID=29299 RepID=A0ABV5KJD9_9ACTN|nr:DUF2510 domain-containing protein [Nocardioides plantarum]